LTVWSIEKAREYFKGSKPNDEEGDKVEVMWKQIEGNDSTVSFSKSDMEKMKAKMGDLVYLSDKRKWFGGLKSIHSVFGEPHEECGLVYLTADQLRQGLFVEGKFLIVEKEM